MLATSPSRWLKVHNNLMPLHLLNIPSYVMLKSFGMVSLLTRHTGRTLPLACLRMLQRCRREPSGAAFVDANYLLVSMFVALFVIWWTFDAANRHFASIKRTSEQASQIELPFATGTGMKGRGIRATRDLHAGELLLVSSPVFQISAQLGSMPTPEDLATTLQFMLLTPRKKQLLDCMFDGTEQSLEYLPGGLYVFHRQFLLLRPVLPLCGTEAEPC